MDNYSTHKHAKVKAWLAANPQIYVHFTLTSGSWLNMVEVWFGIIERQAVHRGSFPSKLDLMAKIREFITRLEPPQTPVHLDQTANVNTSQLQATSTTAARSGRCP